MWAQTFSSHRVNFLNKQTHSSHMTHFEILVSFCGRRFFDVLWTYLNIFPGGSGDPPALESPDEYHFKENKMTVNLKSNNWCHDSLFFILNNVLDCFSWLEMLINWQYAIVACMQFVFLTLEQLKLCPSICAMKLPSFFQSNDTRVPLRCQIPSLPWFFHREEQKQCSQILTTW